MNAFHFSKPSGVFDVFRFSLGMCGVIYSQLNCWFHLSRYVRVYIQSVLLLIQPTINAKGSLNRMQGQQFFKRHQKMLIWHSFIDMCGAGFPSFFFGGGGIPSGWHDQKQLFTQLTFYTQKKLLHKFNSHKCCVFHQHFIQMDPSFSHVTWWLLWNDKRWSAAQLLPAILRFSKERGRNPCLGARSPWCSRRSKRPGGVGIGFLPPFL